MAGAVDPMDVILRTISKLIDADGLEGTDHYYDPDVLVHINTFLLDLYQVGIGPKGFVVDEDTTWTDYLGEQLPYLNAVKDYLYLQTKLVLDPPASSSTLQSYKDVSERILIRLREQVECVNTL